MPILANLLVRVGVTGTDSLDRDFRKAQRSVKGFASELETISKAAVVGVSLPLIGAGAAILRASSQFDGLRRGLTAVSGSAEETERQLVRLREVAKLPGLGFAEAIQGSTALQAAGFSAELAERSLRAFGNALATVGKGREDLQGVILALTQIQAAGKATGQEIRQLQQRLPQIRQAMLAAFGKSRSDEISELGIDATAFITGIVEQFEALPQITSGLKNELENLRDSIEIALFTAGGGIEQFAIAAVRKLDSIVKALDKAGKAFAALPEESRRNMLLTAAKIAAVPIGGLIVAKFLTVFTTIEAFFVGRLIPAMATAGAAISSRLVPAVISIGPAASGASLAILGLQAAIVTAGAAIAAFAIADLISAFRQLQDANRLAAQAQSDLSKSTSVLETRLRQAGVNTRELRQEWIRGEFGAKNWRQVLNDIAVELGNQKAAAEAAARGNEKHTKSLKDQIAEQEAAKQAAERLARAYDQLRLGPGTEKELAESLRLVRNEFEAGRISLVQYIRAVSNYRAAIEKLPRVELPQPIPSPITAGGGRPLDFGVLDQIENLDRGRRAIDEMVDAYNTGSLAMLEGTANVQRQLDLFAPTFQELRRQIDEINLEQFAEQLGVTLTRDLQTTRDEAQQLFDEITASADATAADRLKATARLLDAEIALWRELAFQATGADKERIDEYLRNLEKQERETRSTLNRITGANRRSSDEVSRFWRGMGRQVSTIINDLAREITDVLFPRSRPDQRDVAGITDLGIRAGVTGEQLEALARTIEDLATATGQNFGTLASAAGDLFQRFNVGATQQIPLLEELFDVATEGQLNIADLFRSLENGAAVFQALGINAREAAALIARMNQDGIDSDEVFGNLQKTLDTLTARGFARPAEELQEIIQRIRDAGDVATANSIAVAHFGDAGVEMARLIRAGALDLNGLSTAFSNAGKNIADTAAEVRRFNADAQEISGIRRIFEEIGRSIVRALAEEGVRAVISLLGKLDLLKGAGQAIVNIFRTIAEKIGLIDRASTVIGQLPRNVPIGGIPTIPDVAGGGATGGGQIGGGQGFGFGAEALTGFFTAFNAVGQAIQGRHIETDIGRIEVTTRFIANWLNFNLAEWLGVFQQHYNAIAAAINTQGNNITLEVRQAALVLNTTLKGLGGLSGAATGTPQLAFAGTPSAPFAVQQIAARQEISIGTLNIDGMNVRDPDLVRDVGQAIARHYTARGVRHRRSLR